MQSVFRTQSSALSNPLFGSRISYRIAAPSAPSTTAFRQVTAMAKKKGVRLIVTLECTEAKATGATPSRYTTQKVSPCTPCLHSIPISASIFHSVLP